MEVVWPEATRSCRPVKADNLHVYPLDADTSALQPSCQGQEVVIIHGVYAGHCGEVTRCSGPKCTVLLNDGRSVIVSKDSLHVTTVSAAAPAAAAAAAAAGGAVDAPATQAMPATENLKTQVRTC